VRIRLLLFVRSGREMGFVPAQRTRIPSHRSLLLLVQSRSARFVRSGGGVEGGAGGAARPSTGRNRSGPTAGNEMVFLLAERAGSPVSPRVRPRCAVFTPPRRRISPLPCFEAGDPRYHFSSKAAARRAHPARPLRSRP
jgi:hypothetical protein